MHTKAEAEQFFGELSRFWKRLRDKVMPDAPDVTPNLTALRSGKVRGAILHYTATPTWRSAVRWFLLHRSASAHVVVADHRLPEAKGLDHDLPLVAQLPVTVIQCAPPTMGTWHARWTNPLCYGIENRNVGRVRRSAEGEPWRWWADDWRELAPVVKPYERVSVLEGYEPYSRAQLVANVMLLRYLGALVGGLERQFVLPHSAVQAGKHDTGPLYPIHEVRRLGVIDVDEPLDEAFPDFCVDGADTSLDDREPRSADRRTREPDMAMERAALADEAVQSAAAADEVDPMAPAVREWLDALGYYVPTPADPLVLDVWVQRALWIFQYAHGLKRTSKPDAYTCNKLRERAEVAA